MVYRWPAAALGQLGRVAEAKKPWRKRSRWHQPRSTCMSATARRGSDPRITPICSKDCARPVGRSSERGGSARVGDAGRSPRDPLRSEGSGDHRSPSIIGSIGPGRLRRSPTSRGNSLICPVTQMCLLRSEVSGCRIWSDYPRI
jgi:hypothetical protein